jgi:mono/diheme cytochrome c family protein
MHCHWLGCFLALLISGCTQQMEDQPRVDTLEASPFHDSGISYQTSVPGTIARGELPDASPLATGKSDNKPTTEFPIELDRTLLSRGQERFKIFCSHCHGPVGLGNGMVVQRGFPVPPSYHIDRLRDLPLGSMFGVITDGHGRMPAFGRRIPPRDRWAIIAYVKALQLSQNLPLTELSESERSQLPPRRSQPSP